MPVATVDAVHASVHERVQGEFQKFSVWKWTLDVEVLIRRVGVA